jgi:hypothetical protein
MGAEFNWWLLIVGVVVGGVMTWLVVADSNRRDAEIDDRERKAEAAWIAGQLADDRVDAETVERVLRSHRTYLGFPPPDVLLAPGEVDRPEPRPEPEPGERPVV